MSLNKCYFIGNLTKDPELKHLESGTAVTHITLAVNRNWTTRDGEKKEDVAWPYITVWGVTAENLCKYLHKGDQVLAECRMVNVRKEGQEYSSVQFTAENIQFLTKRDNGEKSSVRKAAETAQEIFGGTIIENKKEPEDVSEDDIPF